MVNSSIDSLTEDSSSSTIPNNSLNMELIDGSRSSNVNSQNNPKINLTLLNAALIAYIERKHHLNVDLIRLSVHSREETMEPAWLPGFIARFLKLDLKPILWATGDKLGYGIRYTIDDGIIRIFGVPDQTFEGRTVVIQVNRRHRIKRELWLRGVENSA